MRLIPTVIIGIGALAAVGLGYFSLRAPGKSMVDLVGDPSPYLLIFAGDDDKADSDFLTVLDVWPSSDAIGEPVNSIPTGVKNSMPHHMEYVTPPAGEPLFMNAHHPEISMIVDISDLSALKIQKTFSPPAGLRFPHDYERTPSGTRLVGFLRSNGASPDEDESITPGNHGGIAEYSQTGELLRTASASVDDLGKAVRPYAFAILPDQDRFIVTSAPMHETSWAEVIQIYRYSDFTLLQTLELPKTNPNKNQLEPVSRATGFGPRVLDDGSVFISTLECSFYHLSNVDSETPSLDLVHTLQSDEDGLAPNHCGIPLRIGNFWVQPVGKINAVAVLDITNPQSPRKTFKLKTPADFRPHWLAKDPRSNRLILGAELGGEQGFYMLRFDETTGALDFDDGFAAQKSGRFFSSKSAGYITLERDEWPHGNTGSAWGHAALFVQGGDVTKQKTSFIKGTELLFAGACLSSEQAARSIQ